MSSSPSSSVIKAAAAITLPNIGGILNGRQVTKANLDSWYHNLKFPSFRPPNWVFGPVWTSLYSSTGYASYLVYRDGGGFTGDSQLPLAIYVAQLGLNWAWSPIFFGHHNIKGGLIDIIALTTTASFCGFLFYRINKIAGLLFLPYIGWLSFATFLNYTLLKLNPEDEKEEQIKKE